MPTPLLDSSEAGRQAIRRVVDALMEAWQEGYRPRCSPSIVDVVAQRLNLSGAKDGGREVVLYRLALAHDADWIDVPPELHAITIGGKHRKRSAAPPPQTRPDRPVRSWILTAAQDATPIHAPFWLNLQAYAHFLGAEILVGGFTYDKSLFTDHEKRNALWRAELVPHLSNEARELLPGLTWCGHLNILPTAVNPLAGLESITRKNWAIVPHAKIALVCPDRVLGEPPKMVMTTGVITHENYIQKRSGQIAEFHHVIGAVVVEVGVEGDFYCRHIAADDDGSFHDLDRYISGGRVTTGHRAECCVWGDIHVPHTDQEVLEGTWGAGGIKDTLRPRTDVHHDLFDFTSRSHHTRHDPHHRAQLMIDGLDSVEAEVRKGADFLAWQRRDWCKTYVPPANHLDALEKWLTDTSAFADVRNARYWCELNAQKFAAVERGHGDQWSVVEYALRHAAPDGLRDVVFGRRQHSYTICQETVPIEVGMHGDVGTSGSRSAASLARLVEKAIVGHTHSPMIRAGLYVAGTSSRLDLPYLRGPTKWAHAHVVAYPNGRRAIIAMRGRKWRA